MRAVHLMNEKNCWLKISYFNNSAIRFFLQLIKVSISFSFVFLIARFILKCRYCRNNNLKMHRVLKYDANVNFKKYL